MIRTQNINKSYGNTNVLNDVDITLPKEKVIAFVGSNGAGKSTLLSIIGRTLPKDSGFVYIDDTELASWNTKELAKKLSILKQANSLNIRLTVYDLVSFGRFPHSQGKLSKEDKDEIDNAIAYMELTDLKDRYLDELSGGQRQMAFIAMVIAQNTEYIFLDEPLNNLDMHHSVQIMKVLQKLVREQKKTVVIVIHDINFVSYYADYILAMKDGKLVAHGNTKDIINSDTLKEIYGMNIQIHEVNGKNICLYYE